MECLEITAQTGNDENHSSNEENLNEIKRIDAADLSYNEFFWNYMNTNIPIIIKSTSENWLCRKEWITTTQDSKINFVNLRAQIGDMKVPVANCSEEYYNSHKKSEMNFYEYLNYWEYKSQSEDKLYLKDWHLKAAIPDYNFYIVPKYFASDWLNEYLIDRGKDDYRFVYMGPEGSWTPFHSDVFSSFSWSTNIYGLKEWIFIIPPDEMKLKDSLGNNPFTINESVLQEKNVKYFIVKQQENESIFVPSGWYHQVRNLTNTISINHNWFNGCNIQRIWKSLAENAQQVVAEIEDCRDMENFDSHCQIMLRATFGMNYEDFLDILEHITFKRKTLLLGNENEGNFDGTLFESYIMNTDLILFDLRAVNRVIKAMKSDQIVKEHNTFSSRCDNIETATNEFC